MFLQRFNKITQSSQLLFFPSFYCFEMNSQRFHRSNPVIYLINSSKPFLYTISNNPFCETNRIIVETILPYPFTSEQTQTLLLKIIQIKISVSY